MNTQHSRRAAIVIAVLSIIVAGLGAGLFVRRMQAGAASPADLSGSLELDGRSQAYFVHLPAGYTGERPLPLVLVLHGATESPEGVEKLSGMSMKADKENFIAVYPRGTGRLANVPTWNSGNCCGYAQANRVNDVGFLRALIKKLERDYAVDPKRIYVTGISNGGMMTYRAACELSDKIAVIAPMEGAQNLECRPSSTVSVIVFHGTAEHLVPFDGGSTPYQLGPKREDNSVAGAISFWVKEDGCAPAAKHEETSAVHTDVYSSCKAGTGVALYAVQGGHHMWPGGRGSTSGVPATDIMWTFFLEHPKQSGRSIGSPVSC